MIDLDALNRAVCERPDDDTPRGVYADALDDAPATRECPACIGTGNHNLNPYELAARYGTHRAGKMLEAGRCGRCDGKGWVPTGYPERAAFIRAQLGLARMLMRPADLPPGELSANVGSVIDPLFVPASQLAAYRELEAKAVALFAALRPDDKHITGITEAGVNWVVRVDDLRQWERGFPATLRDMDGGFWCRHGDELLRRAPVRAVELRTLPEVRFYDVYNAAFDESREHDRIEFVAEWAVGCGGRIDRFSGKQVVTRVMARDGMELVEAARRLHDERIRDARTPLGYVRCRWPKVRFTGPREPGLYTDRELMRESLYRNLGIPALLADPRVLISGPIV